MTERPFRVSVVFESIDWVDAGGGLRAPIPRRLASFSVDESRPVVDALFRLACLPLKQAREMLDAPAAKED